MEKNEEIGPFRVFVFNLIIGRKYSRYNLVLT